MDLHPAPADTTLDRVVLVDQDDREIGTLPKLEAHRQGRCHRAVSVFLRDAGGRLLLQRRAAGKYHSPGLWSNTCCSHPRPGEDVLGAAARRLGEEMGLAAGLEHLFSTHYRALVSDHLIEDEIVHVFGGVAGGPPKPDASEVAGWCWKTPDEVRRDLRARPEAYTVWLRKYIEEFEREITRFASA